MNKYLVFILFIIINNVHAVDLLGDFWEKCPGPACPGNKLEFPDFEAGINAREEKLIREEHKLLDKERLLFEKERQLRDREL